ncbi:MAG: DUF86 domain-containing protein [Deltaproteobacteria bacterium]|nr:DUF86 domain-containing protein [Deltaproteobacteria bacterium]MBI4794666.1 DUF86 domain-containing protein [Deltaproteobacteria bacterium]
MSPPKDLVRLRHMLDYSREALELVQGKAQKDLDSDRLLGLALVRLLEMIGEAANRVSPEFQSLHPSIPWSQIIGLRNRLIHGYDAVDMDILWQILKNDLPTLIEEMNKIFSKAES